MCSVGCLLFQRSILHVTLIQSPRLVCRYVFSSFPPQLRPPPSRQLLLLILNCSSYTLGIWEKRKYRSEQWTGWPFHGSVPSSWLWHWWTKIVRLLNTCRTTHSITTEHEKYITLVVRITWLNFKGIIVEYFCVFLIEKKSHVIVKVKHFWPYLKYGWRLASKWSLSGLTTRFIW